MFSDKKQLGGVKMKKCVSKKRFVAILSLIILLVGGISSFLIYYFTPQSLVPLTEEQEIKVKESFITDGFDYETIDDLYIKNYYGTYDDCIVVRVAPVVAHGTIAYDNPRIVAGCKFKGTGIRVYHNGELKSLKDAYKDGWLSFKDVKDIHYYYSK